MPFALRPSARKWLVATGVGGLLVLLVGLSPFVSSERSPLPAREPRMPTSNTLVIYYSRTGTTAKLAQAIARATGADTERITDTVDRDGFFGFMRSLLDAIRKSGSTLNPVGVDPAAYELVIIGTPDWGQSVAAPTRTFLVSQQGRLKKVAFFLTDGTSDHAKVFAEMAQMVAASPVATLGIPHADVVNDQFQSRVDAFVKQLPRAREAEAVAR
jgi:flavodoxin